MPGMSFSGSRWAIVAAVCAGFALPAAASANVYCVNDRRA